MATLGQVLASPESGWKRFDDSHSAFKYSGSGWSTLTSGFYNSTTHVTSTLNDYVSFNFHGSRLRIISETATNRNSNVKITIDDKNYTYNGTLGATKQALVFELTGLDFDMHYVTIVNPNGGKYLDLDAIDIDDTGTISTYFIPTHKFLFSSSDNNFISYSPALISDTTLIPKMTSNSTPSGLVEASNIWGANYPYKAFDGIGGAGGVWIAAVGALPAWISYEFANKTDIEIYSIKSSTPSRQPKKWSFEGYINDQWVVLDKRDNVTDWVSGTKKTFPISESKSCKKYRLNVEAVNGDPSYLEIDEIEMYGVASYSTVKYLSSIQENDFIRYGLNKSTQIDLSDTVKYRGYVNKNLTILGSGKVFRHSVNTIKTPIKGATIT
ncbi:hypothetical protein H6F38_27615 [Paenibacillus sp. EKM208P]|nr:hypothetical protein H6F38_27615 [Paenibacillus sp. EKM208P]